MLRQFNAFTPFCLLLLITFCQTAFSQTTPAQTTSAQTTPAQTASSHAPKFEIDTQTEHTVKVRVKNRTYVGTPIDWYDGNLDLLRRDGRWSVLPIDSPDQYKVLSPSFSVMSREKMAEKLKKEFGKRYSVSSTASFLVVHPLGGYHKFAKPFEDLNKSFETYFHKRGHHLEKARFPMVAVVLNTRAEYDRMLKAKDSSSEGWVGYYSPRSNRIITYDRTIEESESFFKTSTLIHEATHQTAYNRGIHNRFGGSSSWIVEGVACMFQAEGVYNSGVHKRRKDRINHSRLWGIQVAIKDGSAKHKLRDIVRSDQLFRSDVDLAYAYAWGLTFYLAETQSRTYLNFLAEDAQRPNFSAYGEQVRLERFAEAFGSDFDNLESRMFKFLKQLNVKVDGRVYKP